MEANDDQESFMAIIGKVTDHFLKQKMGGLTQKEFFSLFNTVRLHSIVTRKEEGEGEKDQADILKVIEEEKALN